MAHINLKRNKKNEDIEIPENSDSDITNDSQAETLNSEAVNDSQVEAFDTEVANDPQPEISDSENTSESQPPSAKTTKAAKAAKAAKITGKAVVRAGGTAVHVGSVVAHAGGTAVKAAGVVASNIHEARIARKNEKKFPQIEGALSDARPVAIIVDSACDIPAEDAQVNNVAIVPLSVTFPDGTSYSDGIDLPPHTFYEKLSKNNIPSTSQPSPNAFEEEFQKAIGHGYDVVCITISSKLSGTFQSASIARESLPYDSQERIHVFDSLNLSVGELLLVRVAIQMRDSGFSADQIISTLENLRGQVRLIGLFDSLTFLQKGGRIPTGIALAGNLLSIKPVLGCHDGVLVVLGKARGPKNGRIMIDKSIKKYGGVCFDRPIEFGYSGNNDALLRTYVRENSDLYAGIGENQPFVHVGATIGTHAGPDAITVAFFSKN